MKAIWTMVLLFPLPAFTQSAAPAVATREEATIDWDAYKDAGPRSSSGPDKVRAASITDAVKKTSFPVLIADPKAVRAAPNLQTQGTSYVVHYNVPGMTLSVLGSGSRLISNSRSASKVGDFAPYTFEVNDDVSDLSFSRFGATYTIRASCQDEKDSRCTSPKFLVNFMQSLVPIAR